MNIKTFHFVTVIFYSLGIIFPDVKKPGHEKNESRFVATGGKDQRAGYFSLIVTNTATLTS